MNRPQLWNAVYCGPHYVFFSFFLSQLSKEVAGLNMNFPLQVRPDILAVLMVIARLA